MDTLQDTLHRHFVWTLYMDTLHRHFTWTLYMDTLHEHFIWSLFMDTLYGQYIGHSTWTFLWTLYMDIGHFTWTLYMDFRHGVADWWLRAFSADSHIILRLTDNCAMTGIIWRTIVIRYKDAILRSYKSLVRPHSRYRIHTWNRIWKTAENAKRSYNNDFGLQGF